MGILTELENIGPKLEQQLNAIGVHTPEELRQIGSRQAWVKIKAMDPSA